MIDYSINEEITKINSILIKKERFFFWCERETINLI